MDKDQPPSSIQLPESLVDLIRSDRWPRAHLERRADIDPSRVRALFPEEDDLYFLAPPFSTVARRVREGEDFWTWPFAAPSELDPARVIPIGDFGLGSDCPIILDYQRDARQPCVRYLRLRVDSATRTTDNHWVMVASSFEAFAIALDLAWVDWSAFGGSSERKWPDALLVE